MVDGSRYNCPTNSYSVSASNPTLKVSSIYDVDNYYSIFEPYTRIYSKTIERGFGSSALLSMYSYYETDIIINDTVLNDWNDDLCTDSVCSYMPTLSDLKTHIETFGFSTLITSGQIFDEVRIEDDTKKAVKYILNTYASPILIRTEITWDYYDAINGFPTPSSFTGDKYYFLIVGYNSTLDKFLIQYPEGDRYWWTETFLKSRWGGTNYDGFFIEKQTSIKTPVYSLKGVNTDKKSGNILINGYNYYLENDLNMDHITTNGYNYIDYNNNELYDSVSKENKSNVFNNSVIVNNDIDIAFISKNNRISTTIPLAFIDVSSLAITNDIIQSDYITESTDHLIVNFDTNFYSDIECKLYKTGTSTILELENFNLNRECNLSLKSIVGDYLFNAGDSLDLEIKATDKGTGNIKTLTSLKNVYINYDIHLNPNFPIYCQTNESCFMFDNEILSQLGTYQINYGSDIYDEQLVGTQSIDWDNGETDTDFYIAVGNSDTYTYTIEESTIYTAEGSYDVEYCINTQHNNKCIVKEIIVLDNIIGGGQSGGSVSESESGACIVELADDFDYSGCLDSLIVTEFFSDTLDFGYPLPTQTIFNIPLNDVAYCSNGNTIYNDIQSSQLLYKHTCFEFSDYGDCGVDITYTDFLNMYSLETGSPYKTLDADSYCLVDGGWIPCEYEIPLYEGNTAPIEPSGFCNTKILNYDCNYDCSLHDIDSDGVNDCNDVCCGYDDTLNNDGDSIPNGCDNCPNDPNNDIDSDSVCGDVDNCVNNYNPNQYDTDGDGYGNVCDICEGGDDNIDTDSDGIPDYCEDEDEGGESGSGDTGDISLYNTCHNGVIDSHINETDIDYGGNCGTCDDGVISPYIDETGIDYGGQCGFCLPNKSSDKDLIWQNIPDKTYPFNDKQCSAGSGVVFFPFFILIIIFLLLLIIPIIVLIIIIIIRLIIKKKKKKKNI